MATRIPLVELLTRRARAGREDDGDDAGLVSPVPGIPGLAPIRTRTPRDLTGTLSYPTHHRLLSAREEVLLAGLARQGDPAARQAMMEANIRLVMSVARRYTCKS